jgi:hypothetical protein
MPRWLNGDDEARILALRSEGLTYQRIAAAVGCNPTTVLRAVRRVGGDGYRQRAAPRKSGIVATDHGSVYEIPARFWDSEKEAQFSNSIRMLDHFVERVRQQDPKIPGLFALAQAIETQLALFRLDWSIVDRSPVRNPKWEDAAPRADAAGTPYGADWVLPRVPALGRVGWRNQTEIPEPLAQYFGERNPMFAPLWARIRPYHRHWLWTGSVGGAGRPIWSPPSDHELSHDWYGTTFSAARALIIVLLRDRAELPSGFYLKQSPTCQLQRCVHPFCHFIGRASRGLMPHPQYDLREMLERAGAMTPLLLVTEEGARHTREDAAPPPPVFGLDLAPEVADAMRQGLLSAEPALSPPPPDVGDAFAPSPEPAPRYDWERDL